jgi:hypothetical protein
LDLEGNYGERVRSISELKIKSFADGADKAQILQAQANPLIKGFTTNPSLMRAAGVKDCEAFAHETLAAVTDKPISFEDCRRVQRDGAASACYLTPIVDHSPEEGTRRCDHTFWYTIDGRGPYTGNIMARNCSKSFSGNFLVGGT